MKALRLILALLAVGVTGCDKPKPYVQKGGVWRFGDKVVDVPKGETLTALNARFAKSATRVWYRAYPIEGADAKTFAPLDEHYARDAAAGWYATTYREGKDYYTVEHVRVLKLVTSLPANLRVLTYSYATDGVGAWYEGVPFSAADPATFEPLDSGFARDKTVGYYNRTPVKGSDGATFQPVGRHYARDQRTVYFAELNATGAPAVVEVDGAYPGSFEALDYDYARDRERAYHRDKALGAAGDFQVLDFGYAKTSTAVFYNGVLIPGADVATFTILAKVTDQASAGDKHGQYKDGKRVP